MNLAQLGRRRWVRVAVPLAVAAVSLAAVQVVRATDASAAEGREVVTQYSASDTAATKSLVISCPAGKTAVGAIGSVSVNTGVTVTAVYPIGAQAIVQAAALPGWTVPAWRLSGGAICVTRTADIRYVYATATPLAPRDRLYIQAMARCPAGKALLGFGARVTGGRIYSIPPQSTDRTPDGVAVTAVTEPGQPDSGLAARAVAVCADQVPGATTIESAWTLRSATMTCPTGSFLHAVGGAGSEGGDAALNNVMVSRGLNRGTVGVFPTEGANGYAKLFGLCAS
jgi:hypothetical protein